MPQTNTLIRRRMLLSAVSNWLAFALTLLSAFFLAPYLIHRLGDSTYGVWVFVESVLAYFTLLDLGVTSCVVRFVARHHAQRDQRELNRLVSCCALIFLVAGAIILTVGSGIMTWLAPVLQRKAPGADSVYGFMLIAVINLAFTLPLSLFPAVLDGLERYALKSVVRIVFLVLRVAAIVISVEHQPSLLMLGIIAAVSNLLEHLVYVGMVYHYLPSLELRRQHIDRLTLKKVRGYSVDAFLAMIAGRISLQTGSLVIAGFLNPVSITHFAIAARLIDFAKTLQRSATTTLTPAISALEAQGDHDTIRRIFLHATRWVLYLVLPFQIGFWLFGAPFLICWLGSVDYVTWCYPSLVILSLTLTVGITQSVAARMLYGMGRLWLFSRMALVEAGVNLALSFVLVQRFGIEGIAWAITLPNIVFCLWVIGYTLRQLQLPLTDYVREFVRPTIALGILLVIWMTVPRNSATNWSSLFTLAFLGLVPYGLAVLGLEGILTRLISRYGMRSNVTPNTCNEATRP